MVKVTHVEGDTFNVDVAGNVATTHKVTLSDAYYKKLTSGKVSKEKLIEASFNFLLKREHNTEILRAFTLQTIERYFPGYPSEIKQMC